MEGSVPLRPRIAAHCALIGMAQDGWDGQEGKQGDKGIEGKRTVPHELHHFLPRLGLFRLGCTDSDAGGGGGVGRVGVY